VKLERVAEREGPARAAAAAPASTPLCAGNYAARGSASAVAIAARNEQRPLVVVSLGFGTVVKRHN